MKVNWSWLAASMFAVAQTAVFGQMTNATLSASAAATVTNAPSQIPAQSKFEPVYSGAQYILIKPKLAAREDAVWILRRGGESSQAWSTIASQQPNLSVAHDASTHEPRFCLLSFGRKPWQ